jgi:hypothetical protein
MQMGQLLDEDASRRSMAAMAGGRLRHLVKLYELADLGSSRREMSIADGSNCRQAITRKSVPMDMIHKRY